MPGSALKGCMTCAHYLRAMSPGWRLLPTCASPKVRGPVSPVAQWHAHSFGRKRNVAPCPGWDSRPPGHVLPFCGSRKNTAPALWCWLRAGHEGRHRHETHGFWMPAEALTTYEARECQERTSCGWSGPLMPGEHCACGKTRGPAWGAPVNAQRIPSVSDLRLAYNIAAPFVVRIEYVGDEHEKFYELANDPVLHGDKVVRRWGRIGSSGQSMECSADEAFTALSEKIDKGYRVRAGSVPARPMPQVDPTQDLLEILRNVTQRPATVEQLSDMALRGGWENDGDAPAEVVQYFRGAQAVRLYRSQDARWAVIRYEDGTRTFGKLKRV